MYHSGISDTSGWLEATEGFNQGRGMVRFAFWQYGMCA